MTYHGFDYGDDWQGWRRALTSTEMARLPVCTPPREWVDENGVRWHATLGHQTTCPKCGAVWKFGPSDYTWHFAGWGAPVSKPTKGEL